MSTEENKMSEVYMYYALASDGDDGDIWAGKIGTIFATKNKIPDSILDEISGVVWELCGVLKPGETLVFDKISTLWTDSTFKYYQNFNITSNQDENSEENCEENCEEDYADDYEKCIIRDYISYNQALKECLEISKFSNMTKNDIIERGGMYH